MMSMNTPSSSTSSPSWMIPSSLLRSQKPSKLQSWCCRGGSHPPFSNSGSNDNSNFDFVLHTALDSLSIDTTHARDAREGFRLQIEKLSAIERETSITINRCVDLAKTALFIAAEDDSLISHSSVPLPVDAFIDRLDDLSMGYCSSYSSSLQSSPEKFLHSLEDYLYGKKGFRRSNMSNLVDQRALYLHSVLTHRSGSAVMLSLIYSEILKMLRLWGLVDFDCEIFYPHDNKGLPTGYLKQKSRESDQPHIMTSQTLLEEILRNLKEAFWPFQTDDSKSLFLRAARAADCIDRSMIIENSGFQLASAKAAQHRLDRGVWTSVKFGDMRRALSACERLILLRTDPKELRDYSILLYHCGFYDQSLQYLKMYQESKGSSVRHGQSDTLSSIEEDALGKLMTRLKLILMEEGWSKPSHVRNFLGNKSEPW